MILKIEGNCKWEGCDQPSTHIACGRHRSWAQEPGHPTPEFYCAKHARIVADEEAPEYVVDCPFCGCLFGVN